MSGKQRSPCEVEEELSRILGIVGNGLKKARRSRKLTQRAVADLAKIDLRHYQKIEGGHTDVKVGTLFRVCHSIEFRIIDLFVETSSGMMG